MKVNVNMSKASYYNVIDVMTGMRIPGVQSADDETGIVNMYICDMVEDKLVTDGFGEPIIFSFKPLMGIKIIKKENPLK